MSWAKSREIVFSKFISLGYSADADWGDVLDYLASEAETHAILLCLESVTGAGDRTQNGQGERRAQRSTVGDRPIMTPRQRTHVRDARFVT